MDINDQTRMGGGVNEFDRTPWTEIGRLQSAGILDRRGLIGDLLSKYWKPVYCYLRYKRYDNEQAKDLTPPTHGFSVRNSAFVSTCQ